MKIGDKVRFLSEVGGGKVSGFQGKNTVLVEDEDGFEIPMPLSEVIVVETDDYNIAKVNTRTAASASEKPASPAVWAKDEQEEIEPCDRPITFKPMPMERRDGDKLNLSLCFVPNDVKRISTTDFKLYFVNESNYYMQLILMEAEGNKWRLRFSGIIDPNAKLYVEKVERTMLNDLEHLCVQTLAWKEDKAFAIKPTLSTEIKLDCTKFYKLHTFQTEAPFDQPVWKVPVITDDKSVRSLHIDAEALQQALVTPTLSAPKKTEKQSIPGNGNAGRKGELIEVDLHIEELLETTAGLSNSDMLKVQIDEFHRVMEENIKKLGQKIVFIHGKGNGVLRKTILQELKYRYKTCTWQDASFREYGFGATQVTIHAH